MEKIFFPEKLKVKFFEGSSLSLIKNCIERWLSGENHFSDDYTDTKEIDIVNITQSQDRNNIIIGIWYLDMRKEEE